MFQRGWFLKHTHLIASCLCYSSVVCRVVLGINNMPSISGIKIKKIYYSSDNGELIKTSITKMMKMDDHHMSSYSRNHGYKSTLNCTCKNH